MRWPHLGRRLGMTQLCPPTGAPIAICSSAAIIYLGLDREVRGQLLEDRPKQQRCPHYPRLSKEDITIDFLPQPSSDSLSLLQYVSRLAAVGVTLRRAENANQAEGLAPINGVCLNLALVASTRLLVELYMLITSIRYPHSISWCTEAPSPSPKIQVGSLIGGSPALTQQEATSVECGSSA